MSDLISRQAAAKAVFWDSDAISAIESLPSAQSEIIRCRDCEHHNGSYCHYKYSYGAYVRDNHYCSYAERRKE